MIDKWDLRFLHLAETVSQWSKDPSTKVGCVIANDKHQVVSLGFNGFPRNLNDHPDIYADREKKYERVLHAEQNALIFAKTPDLFRCTLYSHPLPPCNRCALEIIQNGVSRVVSYQYEPDHRWRESLELGERLFEEAGVVYELLEMGF